MKRDEFITNLMEFPEDSEIVFSDVSCIDSGSPNMQVMIEFSQDYGFILKPIIDILNAIDYRQ